MAGPEDMSETGADGGIERRFGDDVRLPDRAARGRGRRGVIGRLSGMFTRISRGADRPQFDLSAPLKSLFAAHRSDDGGGDFSLDYSLRQAADHIDDGKAALGEQARRLVYAIADRRSGEVAMIAHSARLLIALVWAFLAFRLDRSVLAAMADGQTMIGVMPIADAYTLSRVFMMLAAVGVGAAFLGGWLVMGTGGASNDKLRARSAAFGAEAAELAKEFDNDLNRLRDQMERRPAGSPDAAEDLSRMHLTALEAAVFFHDIQFLTDRDGEEARLKFRGYLNAHAPSPRPIGLIELLPLAVFCFMFGVGYGYHLWAPSPEPTGAPVTSLLKYPWAFLAILGLAFIYLGIGAVLDQMRGAITARAAEQARSEALDALRSGFVAGKAPRIEDVTRRVEDALAVFKARLSGSRAQGASGGHHSTDAAGDAAGADLPWRKAPEGPRFATQTFLAAPETFVADPKKETATKFFSRNKRADADPKQSLSASEKPPWLKN